jgi:hypothetical protein
LAPGLPKLRILCDTTLLTVQRGALFLQQRLPIVNYGELPLPALSHRHRNENALSVAGAGEHPSAQRKAECGCRLGLKAGFVTISADNITFSSRQVASRCVLAFEE